MSETVYDLIRGYLDDHERSQEIRVAIARLSAEKSQIQGRQDEAVRKIKAAIGHDARVLWDVGEHRFKPVLVSTDRQVGSLNIEPLRTAGELAGVMADAEAANEPEGLEVVA